jgi:hypothetical protein
MQHEIRRQLQKLPDAGMLLIKLAIPERPPVFTMEYQARSGVFPWPFGIDVAGSLVQNLQNQQNSARHTLPGLLTQCWITEKSRRTTATKAGR